MTIMAIQTIQKTALYTCKSLVVVGPNALPPTNGYQCRGDFVDSPLCGQHIELGCRVPGVENLDTQSQAAQVLPRRRAQGPHLGA